MNGVETPCAADEEKSCMLLVMRVLSIVPLNFKVRKRERGGITSDENIRLNHGLRRCLGNYLCSIRLFDLSRAHSERSWRSQC